MSASLEKVIPNMDRIDGHLQYRCPKCGAFCDIVAEPMIGHVPSYGQFEYVYCENCGINVKEEENE